MADSSKLYKSISLPTGELPALVCVGDLPACDYSVPVDIVTEEVTKHLETHPDLPGVILLKEGRLFGVIPRDRIFERLGHRYGVELFMRKPIVELHKNLGVELFSIPSHIGIRKAVLYALGRPAHAVYEPIVVVYENQDVRLLNVHTLLIAQTKMMDNLNNLVSSLNRIKTALSKNLGLDKTLGIIMKGLKQVVPYHHAEIFLKEMHGIHLTSKRVVLRSSMQPTTQNEIYQFILKNDQPIYIEDVDHVPAWKDTPYQDGLRTWLGVPLRNEDRPLGILSLARRTRSPFSRDDVDVVQAFADYIGIAFRAHSKVN